MPWVHGALTAILLRASRLRNRDSISDLFWLTDEHMVRLEPFFPKSHGKHWVDEKRVLIIGSRCGLMPKLVADLRPRSAIDADIGHRKAEESLAGTL